MSMLRLPGSVAPYFVESLKQRLLGKAGRIINHIKQERGGKLNTSEFGGRMKGTSEGWKVTENLFKLYCRKLGFNQKQEPSRPQSFRRPSRQGSLFE